MSDIFVKLDNVGIALPIYKGRAADKPISAHRSSGMAHSGLQSRRRGSIQALHGISLHLNPGDRLALIGRNGSGKTTLLKVIAGIYPATTGEVATKGEIASMFQMGIGMRPTATGYRNILLQGLVNGLPKSQIPDLTADVEEFTELGEFLNYPVNTYSQGMAMRLNFAIATAMQPDILVMDEWIGAGDAMFRQKATNRIRKVFENSGIAIIASHSRSLLSRLCNQALWLDAGKQMALGPLEEVHDQMDEYYAKNCIATGEV